jgi:hypothetical protein
MDETAKENARGAWANTVLEKIGFSEEQIKSRASTYDELDRIILDRKNPDVEAALTTAVESGVESTRKGNEKNEFANRGKDALFGILKAHFESRKRTRRREIEEEIKAKAAAQAASASAGAEFNFEGSPADPIEFMLRKTVQLTREWQYPVFPVWALHTRFYRQFDVTPRLAFTSPEGGWAKSLMIKILRRSVPNPEVVQLTSGATLSRLIDEGRPVLLGDDFEKMSVRDPILRSIYDAGWEPGANRPVTDGGERRKLDLHTAMAVGATNEWVKGLKSTSLTRTIRFRMLPSSEKLEKDLSIFGMIYHAHTLPWFETITLDLHPPMPEKLEKFGRWADTWQSMFIIAKACGWSKIYGKPWFDVIADASLAWLAEEIRNRRRPDEVMVAIHILQIRDAYKIDAIFTTDLIGQLKAWPDADGLWISRGLNEIKLRDMLTDGYGIAPRPIRIKGVQRRGYDLTEFERLRVLCDTPYDELEPQLRMIRGGKDTEGGE